MLGTREFVISAADLISPEAAIQLSHYKEYLLHLATTTPEKGPLDTFANGYHDYLQAPLQVMFSLI